MREEIRTFARLDLCSQCGGIFVDSGEGVTALGHRYDLAHLARGGSAVMVGPSAISCPSSHGIMSVYRLEGRAGPLELDFCPTCAGVFFDAGEADLFKELASTAGEVVTASGARFSAPPTSAAEDAAREELRQERGGSALATFFEDMMKSYGRHGHRRRRTFLG
jgi:Zn-finger nucleic acid-binding protein